MYTLNSSTQKEPDQSAHKITVPAKPSTATEVKEDSESQGEMYEVVEMQTTSSAKTRYAPTQIPQEGIATQPTEPETSKDYFAQEENQEAYVAEEYVTIIS